MRRERDWNVLKKTLTKAGKSDAEGMKRGKYKGGGNMVRVTAQCKERKRGRI